MTFFDRIANMRHQVNDICLLFSDQEDIRDMSGLHSHIHSDFRKLFGQRIDARLFMVGSDWGRLNNLEGLDRQFTKDKI